MEPNIYLQLLAIPGLLVAIIVSIQIGRAKQSVQNELDRFKKMLEQTSAVMSEFHKFKAAFEASYDAMVIADADGKVLYLNDSVTRITGYTRSEAIGKKAGTLWGGLMPKKYYAALWKTIKKEKKPYLGQIRNHRKNGEEYTADISITPIFDEDMKEVKYFVAVERDISEMK